MLPRSYADQHCSVAAALGLVGDRWTLLVIREAFFGARRFERYQERLGIARNVLADRLGRLVDDGILERRPYQERPERFEYRLTEKGIDLWPVLVSLLQWGDKHVYGEDARPVVLRHRDCGGEVTSHRRCARCGADLGPRDVIAERGPGARESVAA